MGYFDDLHFLDGEVIPECPAIIDARFPDTCNLQFFLRGSLYFGRDGGPRVWFDRPTLFWHTPEHSYQYGPATGQSWHHHWLTFRGPRANRMMTDGFDRLGVAGYVAVQEAAEVEAVFCRLVELVKAGMPQRQGEAVVCLERLLLLAMNPAGRLPPVTERYRERIEATAVHIRENPGATPDFPQVARRLGLSFSHFRKVFRDVTGQAPHDFLLDCRIRRAALWLRHPDRRIKEIAAATGFSSPAQFSRRFRSRTGLTPQAARRASLPWSPPTAYPNPA